MKLRVPTRDTRVAAALANLRIPVRPQALFDERTGREEVTHFFEPESPDHRWQAHGILTDFRTGRLESREPGHPFLVGICACVNREALLDLSNRGTRFHLVSRAAGTSWVCRADAAAALPGCSVGEAVVRTSDLKLAAALLTAGFDLLHLRGHAPSFEWFFAPRSRRADDGSVLDAAELIRRLKAPRRDEDNLHPFFLAYDCLRNRERLLDAIHALPRQIHLESRSGPRRAVISSTASKERWDEVSRFFR